MRRYMFWILVLVLGDVLSQDATQQPFSCAPGVTGLFPVSDQCVRPYFSCINGELFDQTCPQDRVFDPQTLRCTPAQSASCYRPATEGPFACPPGSTGVFPAADNCFRHYYSCVLGQFYLQKCPGNTLFDHVDLRCAPSDSARCSGITTVAPTSGSGWVRVTSWALAANFLVCFLHRFVH